MVEQKRITQYQRTKSDKTWNDWVIENREWILGGETFGWRIYKDMETGDIVFERY